MFEGFKHIQVQTSDPECAINLRYGGSGPPVLLLHGNPLTLVTWHLIAPRLAKDFTVVCADLRGYGDSGKPRGKADHSNYTFRRMAQDQVEVMK
ncbi:MAG: alpha/beta hydrolase, partial [Candidatus Rokuibacteriota bacterium]